MSVLKIINIALCIIFTLCYFYQFIFLFIAYVSKKKNFDAKKISKIAVLICARNEENVISGLINSLKNQDYPQDKMKVFVLADNCTDRTKEVAENLGATVYERENKKEIGKGFALDFLISNIEKDFAKEEFDGYLVFDADNLLEKDFVSEINKVFTNGYDCVTSYRNSKNYGENWLTAGQGMCFMRDMNLLNRARMAIGGCCFVAGTGFLFSTKLCEEWGGGWPFHTLTEDGEFTIYNAINGNKMGYCDSARLYDEQTPKARQSWNQRIRWCKGGVQIFSKYWRQLIRGIFTKKFHSCYDMTMCMAPAYIITVSAVIINVVATVLSLILKVDIRDAMWVMLFACINLYFMFFLFAFLLTVSEWKSLHAKGWKKILYMFTYPIFMLTYAPVAFVALFKKQVKWKPIEHEGDSSIEEPNTRKQIEKEK